MKSLIIILSIFTLTACNTISGLGKDIQKSAEYTSTMLPQKTTTNETKEK